MPYILGSISGTANCKRDICIMAPATIANVAAPSAATDGVPVYNTLATNRGADNGVAFGAQPPRVCTLLIKGTATAAEVLVGTFTLWGYHRASATWYEIPVNGGTTITPVAMAETDTDKITYQAQVNNLGHFERVALQLAAIGGAGASFEAWLVTSQESF